MYWLSLVSSHNIGSETLGRSDCCCRVSVDLFCQSCLPVSLFELLKLKLFTKRLVIALRPRVVYDGLNENWKSQSLRRHLSVGCEGGAAPCGHFLKKIIHFFFSPSPIHHLQQMGVRGKHPTAACTWQQNIMFNLRLLKPSQQKLHLCSHGAGMEIVEIQLTNYAR